MPAMGRERTDLSRGSHSDQTEAHRLTPCLQRGSKAGAPIAVDSGAVVDRQQTVMTTQRIYNRISVFRAERGDTRKQLAEAIGVNSQTIGYLERGDYAPSLILGLKLAERFGVPVEQLFSLTPFPSVASLLQHHQEE